MSSKTVTVVAEIVTESVRSSKTVTVVAEIVTESVRLELESASAIERENLYL